MTTFPDVQGSEMRPAQLVAVQTQTGLYRSFFKRLFDIFFVLLLAPIAVPLILFAALIVARDGYKPFYWQDRVGLNGRVFRMVKLRSMVHDADEVLEAHLASDPAARAEWDHTQKLREDPRVTRFGQMLRKTSLDELPQLWNVLVGQMSIVGPRPFMASQRELYPGHAYYGLRPGISGLWQVSDRNEASFRERAVFDDAYDERLSFGFDLMILVRTVAVVLRCTGY